MLPQRRKKRAVKVANVKKGNLDATCYKEYWYGMRITDTLEAQKTRFYKGDETTWKMVKCDEKIVLQCRLYTASLLKQN